MDSGLENVGQVEKANPFNKKFPSPVWRMVQCSQVVVTGTILEAEHRFFLLEDSNHLFTEQL